METSLFDYLKLTIIGNHAKALACAASLASKEKGFPIPESVVMPSNARKQRWSLRRVLAPKSSFQGSPGRTVSKH
jgi:hypothetical protein